MVKMLNPWMIKIPYRNAVDNVLTRSHLMILSVHLVTCLARKGEGGEYGSLDPV